MSHISSGLRRSFNEYCFSLLVYVNQHKCDKIFKTNKPITKRNYVKIAVAGAGYVGLSIATLLSQHHHVKLPEKVDKVTNRISPIQDDYIEKYFKEKKLDLIATLDGASAYKDADFVVIAAPTNYDPVKNFFDTRYVEQVIELVLSVNKDAVMVIKSTIPVGYTKSIREKYKTNNILFVLNS